MSGPTFTVILARGGPGVDGRYVGLPGNAVAAAAGPGASKAVVAAAGATAHMRGQSAGGAVELHVMGGDTQGRKGRFYTAGGAENGNGTAGEVHTTAGEAQRMLEAPTLQAAHHVLPLSAPASASGISGAASAAATQPPAAAARGASAGSTGSSGLGRFFRIPFGGGSGGLPPSSTAGGGAAAEAPDSDRGKAWSKGKLGGSRGRSGRSTAAEEDMQLGLTAGLACSSSAHGLAGDRGVEVDADVEAGDREGGEQEGEAAADTHGLLGYVAPGRAGAYSDAQPGTTESSVNGGALAGLGAQPGSRVAVAAVGPGGKRTWRQFWRAVLDWLVDVLVMQLRTLLILGMFGLECYWAYSLILYRGGWQVGPGGYGWAWPCSPLCFVGHLMPLMPPPNKCTTCSLASAQCWRLPIVLDWGYVLHGALKLRCGLLRTAAAGAHTQLPGEHAGRRGHAARRHGGDARALEVPGARAAAALPHGQRVPGVGVHRVPVRLGGHGANFVGKVSGGGWLLELSWCLAACGVVAFAALCPVPHSFESRSNCRFIDLMDSCGVLSSTCWAIFSSLAYWRGNSVSTSYQYFNTDIFIGMLLICFTDLLSTAHHLASTLQVGEDS